MLEAATKNKNQQMLVYLTNQKHNLRNADLYYIDSLFLTVLMIELVNKIY
jgi:hypothetical protein